MSLRAGPEAANPPALSASRGTWSQSHQPLTLVSSCLRGAGFPREGEGWPLFLLASQPAQPGSPVPTSRLPGTTDVGLRLSRKPLGKPVVPLTAAFFKSPRGKPGSRCSRGGTSPCRSGAPVARSRLRGYGCRSGFLSPTSVSGLLPLRTERGPDTDPAGVASATTATQRLWQ